MTDRPSETQLVTTQVMDMLTDKERVAFLDIYAGERSDAEIPTAILESLILHGVLARGSDGTLNATEHGDELYQKLAGDEPYEGVKTRIASNGQRRAKALAVVARLLAARYLRRQCEPVKN
jgi:hypothetical protein